MAQPYVGQIVAVGFNFAPTGWLLCNGQALDIASYQVLYQLIGTTYGGNGTTNFNVPNLCGRAAVSMGTGTGLSTYVLGQNAGTESATLQLSQLPLHTHAMRASANAATTAVPSPSVALAANAYTAVERYTTVMPTTTMSPTAIGLVGGSQPHENRQEYLTVNYIIAALGLFPPQS